MPFELWLLKPFYRAFRRQSSMTIELVLWATSRVLPLAPESRDD